MGQEPSERRFQAISDRLPQKGSPDALDMRLIKAIVAHTIQSQLPQSAQKGLLNELLHPEKPLPQKLSDEEVMRWRPEHATLQSWERLPMRHTIQRAHPDKTRNPFISDRSPISPSLRESATERGNQKAVQVGNYRFSPFSFQDPVEKIQSVTTMSSIPRHRSPHPRDQRASRPSMVTIEDQVAYNATEQQARFRKIESQGGTMVDLSGYKDLTKPPVSAGGQASTVLEEDYTTDTEYPNMSASSTSFTTSGNFNSHPEASNDGDLEIYAEYSGNVKTLVQLVNDLPEGVTKQTGAQIIRLTMEAMGISMETVLSDAQGVQGHLLDAVRSNIKKIEEYKTVIRKLETEIRFHQGKANELSEIIDLFILSNTSPNMPNMDRSEANGY